MKTVKPLPRAVLPKIDREQLQQLVAWLSEGVILVDPDGAIAWANPAALEAYGLASPDELGRTAAGFRRRFRLDYRNHRTLKAAQYPLQRLLAGQSDESLDDLAMVGCRLRAVRGGDGGPRGHRAGMVAPTGGPWLAEADR